MRKWMITVVAALLVGAAGFYYWNMQRTDAAKAEQRQFTTALVDEAPAFHQARWVVRKELAKRFAQARGKKTS